MTKEGLINRTIETLEKLPEDKIHEIADFADFILKKYEEQILQIGKIQQICYCNQMQRMALEHVW
ncbi:MAG: DUF2281 domain-containing protein [Lewinellaceae bacterium]|nr:DUF2281 domain-containing protein [Lewinellaceae bacterium]